MCTGTARPPANPSNLKFLIGRKISTPPPHPPPPITCQILFVGQIQQHHCQHKLTWSLETCTDSINIQLDSWGLRPKPYSSLFHRPYPPCLKNYSLSFSSYPTERITLPFRDECHGDKYNKNAYLK